MFKIVTVIGARPQFIKAAAFSRTLRESFSENISEIIVHTGQHFDENMSEVFFRDLGIPHPKYRLAIPGGRHGASTGKMLESVEEVLIEESPDCVLVYGDTNSTLAGALAAAKLKIPVIHVEAGLRSRNMGMPEEVNRILTDRISSLLLCPSEESVENLRNEGISEGVENVGDIMLDVVRLYGSEHNGSVSTEVTPYAMVTCHRAENTDDHQRLKQIFSALQEISRDLKVIISLHPRTKKVIFDNGFGELLNGLDVIQPAPYQDMVRLMKNAKVIITDSGGVQKEAYFLGVPCITMRDESEWMETVRSGWNVIVGANKDRIVSAVSSLKVPESREDFYGDGFASRRIAASVLRFLQRKSGES